MFDFKKNIVDLLNKTFGSSHTIETPDVELSADLEAKLSKLGEHETSLTTANQTITDLNTEIETQAGKITQLESEVAGIEEIKASIKTLETNTETAISKLRGEMATKLTEFATTKPASTNEPIKSEGNGKDKDVVKFGNEWNRPQVKVKINN
jgi:TolA-binding protein